VREKEEDVKGRTETKRLRGRPRRNDSPRRLTVNLPGELRQWLRVHAVTNERDMGDVVEEALAMYRDRLIPKRGRK
jgi:hypothetical protein